MYCERTTRFQFAAARRPGLSSCTTNSMHSFLFPLGHRAMSSPLDEDLHHRMRSLSQALRKRSSSSMGQTHLNSLPENSFHFSEESLDPIQPVSRRRMARRAAKQNPPRNQPESRSPPDSPVSVFLKIRINFHQRRETRARLPVQWRPRSYQVYPPKTPRHDL